VLYRPRHHLVVVVATQQEHELAHREVVLEPER